MDNVQEQIQEAKALERAQKDDAALDVYASLSTEPGPHAEDPAFWLRFGELLRRKGRPEEAAEAYERSIGLLDRAGQRNSALAVAKRLSRVAPDSTSASLRLGEIAADLGYGAFARDGYLRAAESAGGNGDLDAVVEGLRKSWSLLVARGLQSEADAVRARVVEIRPDADPASGTPPVATPPAAAPPPAIDLESPTEAEPGLPTLEGFEPTVTELGWEEEPPSDPPSGTASEPDHELRPDSDTDDKAGSAEGLWLDEEPEPVPGLQRDRDPADEPDAGGLPGLESSFDDGIELPGFDSPSEPEPEIQQEPAAADDLPSFEPESDASADEPLELETLPGFEPGTERPSDDDDLKVEHPSAAADAFALDLPAEPEPEPEPVRHASDADLDAIAGGSDLTFLDTPAPPPPAEPAREPEPESVREPAPERERKPEPQVETRERAEPETRREPDETPEDYIDLAALILSDEAADGTRFSVEAAHPSGDEDRDFAEILSIFRRKVSENIHPKDSSSHYDLGVAYKEMGLLDDAIGHLQLALRAGSNPVATLEVIGECFVEKGEPSLAKRVLERAARIDGATDADLIGVLYWLGRCEEEMSNGEEARGYYEKVIAVEISFRDAASRLERLRGGARASK